MKSIRSLKSSPKKLLFDISEEHKQEIKEAFDVLDSDKINAICFKDLNIILRALGFEVTKEEISKISKEFEKGDEDLLRYEEFYEIMQKKFIEKDPYEELRKSFNLICEEGTNLITLKSLQNIAKEMGENMSDEELKEMLREVNKTNEDEVYEDDFIKFMSKNHLED